MYLYCEKKLTMRNYPKTPLKKMEKASISFYFMRLNVIAPFFFASLNEQLCLQVNLALECFIFTAVKL